MLKSIGLAVAALALAVGAAAAQSDYPTKPVTIITPFGAGGPSDVNMRFLAEALTTVWGQPVVVENKPGGGTVIGNTAVLNAPADGYTLGQISGSFTTNPSLRSLPYETMKDFTGVTIYANSPIAYVSFPDLEANNIKELIELSKKRTLTYGSSGIGSSSHMAGALVQAVTGADFRHVPYRGSSDAIADLLAGRIDFGTGTWSTLRPYVMQGKLKLIAISDAERVPEYPDVETLIESIPEMAVKPVGSWIGIMVRSDVPADVVAKISDGIRKATELESFKKQLIDTGSIPRYLNPEQTNAQLNAEIASWGQVVKDLGIELK